VGNIDFTFPLGKLAGGDRHFRPLSISAPGTTADHFTAEFWRENPINRGPINPDAIADGLSHISRCEYWDLVNTNSSTFVNVTLSWSNNPIGRSICNVADLNFPYVDNLPSLVVVPYEAGLWGDQAPLRFGQTSTSGSTTPADPFIGTITWNGPGNIGAYQRFTLGSTDFRYNPLPFQLLKFEGRSRTSDVLLNWKVTGNQDQQEYLLEHSTDGIHFKTIAVVPALADLNQASYSDIHAQPVAGLNHYRVTAKSRLNQFKSSQTIQVWFGKAVGKPGIYPNPIVNSQVNIHTNGLPKGVYNIHLVGMDGKLLQQQRWVHTGNQPVYQLQLNPALPRGMYWIHISGDLQEPIQLKILK
jgi:hypothetical protein